MTTPSQATWLDDSVCDKRAQRLRKRLSWIPLLLAVAVAVGMGLNVRRLQYRQEASEAQAMIYVTALDSTDTAVIVTDARGVITSWSDGAVVMFGWRATEMIDRPLSAILPGSILSTHLDDFKTAAANGETRLPVVRLGGPAPRSDGNTVEIKAALRMAAYKDNINFLVIINRADAAKLETPIPPESVKTELPEKQQPTTVKPSLLNPHPAANNPAANSLNPFNQPARQATKK